MNNERFVTGNFLCWFLMYFEKNQLKNKKNNLMVYVRENLES